MEKPSDIIKKIRMSFDPDKTLDNYQNTYEFLPEIYKNSPCDLGILASWTDYFRSIRVPYKVIDYGGFYCLIKIRRV